MSTYYIYNPNDNIVPNRVVEKILYGEPSIVETKYQYFVKDPDITTIHNIPDYYLKVENNTLVEMTETEKDKIDKLYKIRKYAYKDKIQLINQIWGAAETEEQKYRLILAIRKYPDFLIYLEEGDYNFARYVCQQALQNGDITEEDYNLIDENLPLS